MAKYQILKAVEFDKTSAKFRKQYGKLREPRYKGIRHDKVDTDG